MPPIGLPLSGSIKGGGGGALAAGINTDIAASWSPILALGQSGGHDIGNYTAGSRFIITKSNIALVGARVPIFNALPTGVECDLKVSVWTIGTMATPIHYFLLATKTIHLTTINKLYTVIFDTPYIFTNNDIGWIMGIGCYETTGTRYYASTGVSTERIPPLPLAGSPALVWVNVNSYANGDQAPSAPASAQPNILEPILQNVAYVTETLFTQPAPFATVDVTLQSATAPTIMPGQQVRVIGGGYYYAMATSVVGGFGVITLMNIGDPVFNVVAGAVIPAGAALL